MDILLDVISALLMIATEQFTSNRQDNNASSYFMESRFGMEYGCVYRTILSSLLLKYMPRKLLCYNK